MSIKVLKSSLLSSGAQLASKSLGLISTLILARILTPNDFALIAVISIVLYFFDVLSNSGSEQYIIQKRGLKENDLNTAWTLDLLIKTSMFILLIVFAPYITLFLGKPEITNGLKVASLLLLINALKQPKLILLKRQLKYQILFRLSLSQKVVSFIVIVLTANILENFWAFIIADIVGATFFLVSSYAVIPKAPKLSLANIKLQWVFSKWLLGKNILGYLRSQIDTLFVSKFFNNDLLGNYQMAREIAMLPGQHFLSPAIEPLLASFKNVKNNKTALALQFNKALIVLSLIATPICIFLIFYSELIVTVLLGEQWKTAGVLLSIFSILFIYWVYLLLIEAGLTALGKVKLLFWLDLISLLLTIGTLSFAIAIGADIELIAMLRTATGVGLALISLLFITFLMQANFFKTCSILLWPAFPALVIAYSLKDHLILKFPAFIQLAAYGSIYFLLTALVSIAVLLSTQKLQEHKFVLNLIKLK